MPLYPAITLVDTNGNILGTVANPLQTVAGSASAPGVVRIEDGTSTNLATVSAFHNADNQTLAATAFGILTGGVAQLLNASGNLDRQRETAADVIGNTGIATGTQQLAWPVTAGPVTSGAITGSATAQTITLTNVSGTSRGVAWSLIVGQSLILEPNTATQEAFTITAINVGAKTVTGVIKNNHAITAPATAFFYDQARSGIIADGSTGQGIAAGATYLFNSSLNSGNGGWESERSASGELDGASGTGTAIAAEYEHNSGGPVLATGLASGFQFDRARNLQGKGAQTQTITATGVGNTTVVFGSAAATNLVQPGSPLTLSGGAAQEVVYVTAAWVPGSSATVPLQSPVVNAGQTTARLDVFAPQGPQLNGFTPYGIGIEEECLFDPVSGLYYIERSATQDAVSGQNVVLESVALFNGATFDRLKGLNGAASVTPPASFAVYTEAAVVNGARLVNGNITGGAIANNASTFLVSVNVTAFTGGTNLTYNLQVQDSNTNWVTVGSSVTITATGSYVFSVGPGTTNGNVLPAGNGNWRVSWAVSGTFTAVTSQIGITGR